MTHKYKLRYKFEIDCRDEDFTKEDINAGSGFEDYGLADGLFCFSLLYPEDGSYSQQLVVSYNGEEKRHLTPEEVFKIWSILGLSLYDSKELTGWQADVIKMHAELIRSLFKGMNPCTKI